MRTWGIGRFLKTRKTKAVPLDEELARFFHSLSVMLSAGVSLNKILDILIKQTESENFKSALIQLRTDVHEKGAPLSRAMAKHKRFFPEEVVSMIEAGETGGRLPPTVGAIARYTENSLKLRQKIRAASSYPLFVGIISIALFALFFYFILPKIFDMIFQGMQAKLPFPTRVLVDVVNLSHSYFVLVPIIVAALFVRRLLKFFVTEEGKKKLDSIKMKLPYFSPLYKKFILARFSSTLGSLLETGVTFVDGLKVSGKATGSASFNSVVEKMIDRMVHGATLGRIMEMIPYYPHLLRSMTAVGESTGRLPEMLVRAARMYENEVDYQIERFLALFEPALILSMGAVVGFVVLSVFLPVYSAVNTLGQ